MKLKFGAILSLLTILLAACGGEKYFQVSLEGQELGTQVLTAVYTLSDGNRSSQQVTVVDGRGEFRGHASNDPSVVEIFNSSAQPLVVLIAKAGDDIKVQFNGGVAEVGASELSTQLSEAVKLLPEISEELPEAVQKALKEVYVSNVGETPQEFKVPKVWVRGDSVVEWDSEGIWVFTASSEERTSAFRNTLRKYVKSGKQVNDIYLGGDSTLWFNVIRGDSAKWRQGMLPAGPADVEALTSTPMAIEVDSTGHIVRRTSL